MFATSSELVAALQRREISASELLERAIARIEHVDSDIHAVVARDFERARAAASAADVALARGERRPLLGLPMTVKEAINVAGLPTTWGIPGTQHIPVRDDALVVQRLKAAGAVILGKTNVPENLADYQSYNDIYGTTRNPWDLARSPGGSSGGSAAALAAGCVSLELGTDMAGSLRVPAHFCGVFAHKPTHELVPMRGVAPPGAPSLVTSPAPEFAVVGPMARSAADLSTALEVLAGPDALQATGYRLALAEARHTKLADFRVLLLDTHPLVPTSNEVSSALHRFADRLAKSGCKLASGSPLLPDLRDVASTFTRLMMSFVSADMPEAAYRELQAAAAQLPSDAPERVSAPLRAMVMSHRDWIQASRQRAAIANQFRELFRSFDIVLCPVSITTAFTHDHSDYRTRRIQVDGVDVPYGDQGLWITLATLAGLPATVVPVGVGESGLPVGVQIIGPAFEDRSTLAFASLAEREFGGFVPPAHWTLGRQPDRRQETK